MSSSARPFTKLELARNAGRADGATHARRLGASAIAITAQQRDAMQVPTAHIMHAQTYRRHFFIGYNVTIPPGPHNPSPLSDQEIMQRAETDAAHGIKQVLPHPLDTNWGKLAADQRLYQATWTLEKLQTDGPKASASVRARTNRSTRGRGNGGITKGKTRGTGRGQSSKGA